VAWARTIPSSHVGLAPLRRSPRLEGFSLHADVAVPARWRDRLEHLARYLVRPPRAQARIGYYLRRREGVAAYLRDRQTQGASVRSENESRFDPAGVRARLMARRVG